MFTEKLGVYQDLWLLTHLSTIIRICLLSIVIIALHNFKVGYAHTHPS